jgi:hypothetical protein
VPQASTRGHCASGHKPGSSRVTTGQTAARATFEMKCCAWPQRGRPWAGTGPLDMGPINGHRHDVSPGAASRTKSSEVTLEETSNRTISSDPTDTTCIIDSRQRERDLAFADVAFLRSQLEQRAEELRRRDQAEERSASCWCGWSARTRSWPARW